jgi:hypothetical protein
LPARPATQSAIQPAVNVVEPEPELIATGN